MRAPGAGVRDPPGAPPSGRMGGVPLKKPQALFAAAVLLVGAIYLALAYRMPRGTLAYPGPGFYPVLVGWLLAITSAASLGWELRTSQPGTAAQVDSPPTEGSGPGPAGAGTAAVAEPGGSAESPPGRAKALQLVGVLAFYVLALQYLGFLVAAAVLLSLSTWMFGLRRPLPVLAFTAVVLTVAYLLFVSWLKVPLPRGSLW